MSMVLSSHTESSARPAAVMVIKNPTVEQLESEGLYYAVITKVGAHPELDVDAQGTYRFAYRNLKKLPGDSKPWVEVGDRVTCRLTAVAPRKAVSVRHIPKDGLTLTVTRSEPLSDVVYTVDSDSTDQPAPITPLSVRSGSSDGQSAVAFTHDPYSPTGRSIIYADGAQQVLTPCSHALRIPSATSYGSQTSTPQLTAQRSTACERRGLFAMLASCSSLPDAQ